MDGFDIKKNGDVMESNFVCDLMWRNLKGERKSDTRKKRVGEAVPRCQILSLWKKNEKMFEMCPKSPLPNPPPPIFP